MIQEIWAPLVSFRGYEVSTRGDIRNATTKHLLKKRAPHGYVSVSIFGRKIAINPGRYVIETFTGVEEPEYEVVFKDGNPMNAALDNVTLEEPRCPYGHVRLGANRSTRNQCKACALARSSVEGWSRLHADEIYDRLLQGYELPPRKRNQRGQFERKQ